jgi:hypothetical protein
MFLVLRWLARRSLRFLHALGALLGWIVWAAAPSYRRRLAANAAAAGIGGAERRAAVAEAGRMVLEMPRLWLRPSSQPWRPLLHPPRRPNPRPRRQPRLRLQPKSRLFNPKTRPRPSRSLRSRPRGARLARPQRRPRPNRLKPGGN